MKFGPQIIDDKTVKFNLWAPSAEKVELILNDMVIPMPSSSNGWFQLNAKAKIGDQYKFKINSKLEVPDPASRFQPNDVDGSSEIVDNEYDWTNFTGKPWEEAVIYELHVGTFSKSGNYQGVEEKLDYFVELGITAIELMPLAAFKGKHGWGYDGVLLYAPDSIYGTPSDLKHLIDTAHKKGIMVFLDVVYNHFGPAGNYLHEYAKDFFTEKHQTLWGAAINFAIPEVRDFFIENALYWFEEYRFDGLRFDAVHAIMDDSEKHFLYELSETIRERISPDRHIHLILENDKNQARYLAPEHFNAQWNDDSHHLAHVLLTSETGGYYVDYKKDTLGKLGRVLAEGFAYQGDPSPHRNGEIRGENSSYLPPTAFINFLQNHDQIGNRVMGERLSMIADEKYLELALAVTLLAPSIPMLFMGEEWAAKTPFLYFCDFEGELASSVREGRRKEFSSFAEFSSEEAQSKIPDPNAETTFQKSKLDWLSIDQSKLNSTKQILILRRKYIIPLLKSGWLKSNYTAHGESKLGVDWYFKNNKILKLKINLTDDLESPAAHVIWQSPNKQISFVIEDNND